MKLQIKFKIKDEDGLKDLNRSITFTNINTDLEDEAYRTFADSYMSLTKIEEFELIKILTQKIEKK